MNNINDSDNQYIEQNNENEEVPLGILNLEIEKGVIKQIKIYKNINPDEVAYNFCKENNINFSLTNKIKNEIESLIQKIAQSSQNQNIIKDNISQKSNLSNNNNLSYMNDLNSKNYNDNINNNNILNEEKKNNNFNNSKSNEKNKRKLFFYQFLQKEKNPYMNKSNTVNLFKNKLFNTIGISKNNFNKIPHIHKKESFRYNNTYLTQTFLNNNNSNIFNRLYNDAKIKRVFYKRPCHFSSSSKKNRLLEDYSDNIYETINGKTFNKKTLDMKPSYLRSYQIKPNKLFNKEYTFHPNLSKYSQNSINTNNLNNLINTYTRNVTESSKNNNIFTKFKRNNLNFNKKGNNILYEESYIPLKNKIKHYSYLDINKNMEMLSIEAFNNIFNKLSNYDQNHILNKNTLNINNIDNNSVLILSPIINDINNNELELNIDNFIKRILTDLSNEDKNILIINELNLSSNNNCIDSERNIKPIIFKHNSFNRNKVYNLNKNNRYINNNFKTPTYSDFKKYHGTSSSTEKKRNFYYL